MMSQVETLIASKLVSDAEQQGIKLVISRSLLSRLLGCRIKKIEVWAYVVWVLPERGSPRFVSRNHIWNGFHEIRKKEAQVLSVHPPRHSSELALVVNACNSFSFSILSENGHPVCECIDFQRQREVLGVEHSACKHILAYYSSLRT